MTNASRPIRPSGTAPEPPQSSAATRGVRDLGELRLFTQVVELQSFSEVARRSGVTPATVSKRVAALEATLGVRLVNRTTRRLFVTEAGQRLYQHGVRVIRELDEAESALSEIKGEPAGSLHVAVPLMFATRWLAPRLPEFVKRFPRIALDVSAAIEKVDLFQEHIDIAVRIADKIEPGLVAFKLAPYRRAFYASPEYLLRRGTPRVPEDLVAHNCVIGRGAKLNAAWEFERNGEIESIRVSGNFVANNGELVRFAALAGLGIAMGPRWQVAEDLEARRLKLVLEEFVPTNRAVYAVLPRQGPLSPKTRAFVDFLKEVCASIT